MLLETFRKIVDAVMSRVDYYAVRAGRVVLQHGDGTCDVRLDDPRFPDLARVPYRSPAVKLTFASGARVLMVFEDGDPSRPAIVQFDSATVLEMTLGGQDGIGVARQGDMVSLTMPPAVAVTGTVVTSPTLPPATAFTGLMTVLTPLSGVILTGSGKVKASS